MPEHTEKYFKKTPPNKKAFVESPGKVKALYR